jgi:hypothetical protein
MLHSSIAHTEPVETDGHAILRLGDRPANLSPEVNEAKAFSP